MTTPDYSQFDDEFKEQLDKIQKKTSSWQQVQALKDMVDMTQDMNEEIAKLRSESTDQTDKIGALLTDMREALTSLRDRKDPELPDYAKPVVDELKTLRKAIDELDLNPEIRPTFNPTFTPDVHVDAPQVSIDAPDLSKVERILKTDLPKAFQKAVQAIPPTLIPEQDNSAIISALDEINSSIEDLVNKPIPIPQFPNQIKVINPDGTAVSVKTPVTERYDYSSPPVYYVGSAPVGTDNGSLGWTINQFDLTDPSNANGLVATDVSWSGRAGGSYQ